MTKGKKHDKIEKTHPASSIQHFYYRRKLTKPPFYICLLFVVSILAFGFGACSNPVGTEPEIIPEIETYTYTGTRNNVNYTLVISQVLGGALHEPGDDFELTVGRGDTEETSSGTVVSFLNNVFTLQPSYGEAETFRVTVSGNRITNITGLITFDDGSSERGPGAFTTGGGGGGSSGGGGGDNGGGGGSIAHSHDWGEWTETFAPTCTEDGEETRVCKTDSSHTETRKGADRLGHDWGGWETTTAATATTDGEETRVCGHNSAHTETRAFLYATGTAGLTYTLNPDGKSYTVNRGTATSGALFIPAYHRPDAQSEYLPVTATADYNTALSGVTSVTFAHNSLLETIGRSAFNGTGMTSIEIPASVVTIGREAFNNTGLTSVTIPASVKTIGIRAFNDCANLESVTFAAGSALDSIGNYMFQNSGLKSITIPASVKFIGQSAFQDCASLESVTFEQGSVLETIYHSAFSETGIKNITIPASVTAIFDAFKDCASLESLIFEEGSLIETIHGEAFAGSGFISIVIPSSVKTIYISAFSRCTSLTTVYYGGGDAAAWNDIDIYVGNDNLKDATHYYYSATNQADTWRWVDGVPTAW